MLTFNQYLERVNAAIENLPYPAQPAHLYEPISYTMALGGKRIRPVLVLMACEAVGGDIEKAIMPASMELCGEYGESGLFAGVPCVIGANGVEEVVELPLTAEEKETFHKCCEGIRHNMEHLKEL